MRQAVWQGEFLIAPEFQLREIRILRCLKHLKQFMLEINVGEQGIAVDFSGLDFSCSILLF